MRVILCLVILMTAMPAVAQVDKVLQNQLVKLAEQNRQVRQSLEKYDMGNVPTALQSVSTEIYDLHKKTLQEIITLNGWPNKQRVGEVGVKAAFILVKHSSDLIFQQDMLPLVIQSYLDEDGIAGQDVAELTDNVSIKLGKKQVFGTQANWINGEVIFLPIEDEQTVDQLRDQMGMSSLAEYKKALEALYNLQSGEKN